MQKIFKLFAGLMISLMFISTTSFAIGETRILQFENPHATLEFGDTCIGVPVTKELKLLNNGNSSLTVNDIRFHENLDGAYVSDFSGSLVIEANSSAIVNVTFTPTEEQSYLGLVYVESDRTNTNQDRSHVLGGNGTAGCGEPIPPVETKILAFENPHAPLDFGDEVCIGSSVSKVLRVFNNGTAPLTVSSIRFHENLNGAYVLNSAGSFVIDANGSVDVNITFTPTAEQPYIGLVYVESDRTNTDQDRSHLVSGTGKICMVDTRILAFENPHSALAFGNTSTCTPSTQALKIFNNGNSPLAITDVRFHENLEGAYTSDFTGSLVIEANSSAVVNITFTPTAEQPYVGLVYVESNRTNTDQDRSHVLSGMGTDIGCEGSVLPVIEDTRILAFESPHTPFNFSDVDVNTSVTLPFKIMNTGTAPLTINEIRFHSSLEGSVTADFTPDAVISAGDSILVDLTFSPTAEQTYVGLIYVESDRTNVNQDRSLLLVGTGTN